MYRLPVKFEEEELDKIAASDKKVVLINKTAEKKDVPLPWVSFAPLQQNIITWDTEFSVYSAKTVPQNGAQPTLTGSKETDK